MRKTLAALAMSVVMAGFSLSPAWAVDVTELATPLDARVLAAADLMDAPGAEAAIVGSLAEGEDVLVTGYADDWLQVAGPDGEAAYLPAGTVLVPASSVRLPATAALDNGTTITLTATRVPAFSDPTLTWKSSDTAVATVDTAGVVFGKKAGKAKITATTPGGVSSSTDVTVRKVSVSKLRLDPGTAVVKVGAQITLAPVFTPANATNRAVTWSSANKKIATVSASGVVTGKKVGTVKITAKAADGNKVATATVKVAKAKTTLTATGAIKVPDLLKPGTVLKMAGTVKSNYTLTSVSASVYKIGGGTVYSASARPSGTSYNLGNLAAKLKFENLELDSAYRYVVKASDASGKTITVSDKSFFVSNNKADTGCVPLGTVINSDGGFPVAYTAKKGSVEAFLQIALSQVGYNEGDYNSKSNCVSFPSHSNWSKYGLWEGWPQKMRSPNQSSYAYAWCAVFVSWVADQNGMLNTKVPNYIATEVGWKWFNARGKFHKAKGYTPVPGDIVFYGPNKNPHTGIVLSAGKNGAFTSVEGNTLDAVKVMERNINSRDYVVFGFGSIS